MKIRIFIEKQELQLSEDVQLALTYSFADLEEPTTLTGDYSKEITIVGPPVNNIIFGNIWKIDRVGVVGGNSNVNINFNASKRANAEITAYGTLLMRGYVKLNSITNKNGKIQYKITFFSEMCNKVQELFENKLRDLPFPNDLLHLLQADTINSIWTGQTTEIKDYLTYVLSNSGLYDDFDSGHWLTKDSSGSAVVTEIISGVDFDEMMLNEYRVEYQRPALKIKALIQLIAQQFNISLDPAFFNDNNPYFSETVMCLPRYNQSGFNEEVSATGMQGTVPDGVNNGLVLIPTTSSNTVTLTPKYKGDGVHFAAELSEDINLEGYGKKSLALEFRFGVSANLQDNNGNLIYGVVGRYNGTYSMQPFYPNVHITIDGVDYPMTAYMPGMIGSLVFEFYGMYSSNGLFYDGNIAPQGPGDRYFYPGYRPNGNRQTGLMPVRFTLDNIPANAKKGTVHIQFDVPEEGLYMSDLDYNHLERVENYVINVEPMPDVPTTGLVNLDHYYPYSAGFTGKNATFSNVSAIRSGYLVSKNEIIDGEMTVGKFLVDYCKLFGLLFTTDYAGKLNIVSRNTFFADSDKNIEDWTDKIDYSKTVELYPLNFDVQRFVMKYADGNTFYEQYYRNKTGYDYGEQEIRTGYEFNSNAKNLFDDNLFSTPVTSIEKSRVLVGNKLLHINNTRALPALFEKDGEQRVASNVGPVLLFNAGDEKLTLNDRALYLSDDDRRMIDQNIGGGEYCWIDFSKVFDAYGSKRIFSYPKFSELDKSGERSLLFGVPKENYANIPPSQFTETNTIYSRFWSRYFEDMYNVDNKRMICYVMLNLADVTDSVLSKFVTIENTLWRVNRIVDYSPTNAGPTKVELVQVRDTMAYSNGQII